MPEAIMGQVAGAVVGGLLGGQEDQTATQTRTPWGPAQPWMQANITQGQDLQNQYRMNPFSQAQQNAYGNSFGLSNAYRALLPSLLGQMGQHTGFDRTNPLARPQAYNYGAATQNLGFTPQTVNPQMFANAMQTQVPTPVVAPVLKRLLDDLEAGRLGYDYGGTGGV